MVDPIQVLVAADPILIRRGLALMLSAFDDILRVGEVRKGSQAIAFCKTGQVDVILMDLYIRDEDCIATIAAIHKHFPQIQVIVLANFDEATLMQQALAAGSAGVLFKNAENNELSVAIRQAHQTHHLSSTDQLQDMMQSIQPRRQNPQQLGRDLTGREIEVLTQISRGLTNAQIGREMHTSRATIKTQVSSILSKLGVSTRTEAAALAIELQLVSKHLFADELAKKAPGSADNAREAVPPNLDHVRSPLIFGQKHVCMGQVSPAPSILEIHSTSSPSGLEILPAENHHQPILSDALSLIDPGGKALVNAFSHAIVYANPAYRAITPHPEVDPVGQLYECIWPDNQGFTAWEPIQQVSESGIESHIQCVPLCLGDGSTHLFTYHVIPMEWAGQKLACLVWWDTTGVKTA